jgi:hypothetical protein
MTFNVTLNKLTTVISLLSKLAVVTGGSNTWTIEGDGLIANVVYVEPTLNVNIIKKPFYISDSMIENEIEKIINETN